MRKYVLALLTLAASAVAAPYAGVGSIISSFPAGDLWYWHHRNIVRDAWSVLMIENPYNGGGSSLARLSPRGRRFGETQILDTRHRDADHSPWGDGYITAVRTLGVDSINEYDIATGSCVASWGPPVAIFGVAYVPGSAFRYVGGGDIYRFTAKGSLVDSFSTDPPSYYLAATDEYAGMSGEYILAPRYSDVYVYTSTGERVGSFTIDSHYADCMGACCGPGFPPEYGTTYWCVQGSIMDEAYVYQVHLGNATAVEPASLGRIKAMFR